MPLTKNPMLFFVLACLVVGSLGCQNQDQKSANHQFKKTIDPQTMQQAIKAAHLIEAYRNTANSIRFDSVSPQKIKFLYAQTMAKFGISNKVFIENYKYYQINEPQTMSKMLDSINTELNVQLTKMN